MLESNYFKAYNNISSRAVAANLAVFGLSHLIVDAACAALIFSFIYSKSVSASVFAVVLILYNVLAFSLQALFGLLMDRLQKPVMSAVSGFILIGMAIILFKVPLIAVIFAGIGNALFHVGGGMVSLNLHQGKAWTPGIYVAPGALGLLLGTLIGRSGNFKTLLFLLLLGIAATAVLTVKIPRIDYSTETKSRNDYFGMIIILLLMSVSIRSLVGLALDYPWKANVQLLIPLTFAVFLGKALGGVLADKFGWMKISVSGLVICIPLIILGGSQPVLVMIGMFLFNMTMPVTLAAISNMLPGRPGFSFGLTTLALIIGAMPVFAGFGKALNVSYVAALTAAISAAALYKGLQLYFSNYSKSECNKGFIKL